MLPRAANMRVLRTACRPALRPLTTNASSSSAGAGRRGLLTALASGGIILGSYATYTYFQPVNLDAHSARPKKPVKPAAAAPAYIPYAEVQKHNTRESCWVIIDGQVYDATSVLRWHPAGPDIILQNAGKDATKAFVPVHPPNILSHLPPSAHLGPVDPATMPEEDDAPTEDELRVAGARAALPPPEAALNLHDIERFAESVLSKTAWAYYRSTGDDEYTYFENFAAFKRFWFRPRVLRKVSQVSTETRVFGQPASLPIYISPSALARLGHPDGEMNLTRAAGKEGILLGLSNNASCSREEVMSVKTPEQSVVFQLYMNVDRTASAELIRRLEPEGFKAIMLTVDAAVPGKRELDQRAKGILAAPPAANGLSGKQGMGVAHAISAYQDPDVTWDDVRWIQSLTKLPLIIKGIQCVEDAEKAFDNGAQAIILSNHGGRELDFAPAPMTVLYELHQQRPDLLRNHEVYIDGGIRRGTDVLKALCLGARGVGLGRPFLYANGAWGEEGCRRVIQIMREEIVTGMQLLGVTSLEQLTPDLVRYVDRDPPPHTRE